MEAGVAPINPEQRAKIISNGGGHVRRLPILTTKGGSNVFSRIVINTATLMETFAILVEMNHLANAYDRKISFWEMLDFLPNSVGYLETMLFTLFDKSTDINTLFPTLTSCIDIALMYDPFVLFNARLMNKPHDGEISDQYPGETFILACNAAKKIEPAKNMEQAPKYYERLCKEMGLPTPSWMSGKALEVASSLLSKVESANIDNVILGKAMVLHKEALQLRNANPSLFPFELPTSAMQKKILDLGAPCVTFYNLITNLPLSPYEDRTDVIQMHNLLRQVLLSSKVDCPLRNGNPFSCPHSDDRGDDVLCVWKHPDGQSFECRADFFDAIVNQSR